MASLHPTLPLRSWRRSALASNMPPHGYWSVQGNFCWNWKKWLPSCSMWWFMIIDSLELGPGCTLWKQWWLVICVYKTSVSIVILYGFVVLLRGRGALEHQQLGLQEIRGTMSSYCNCCQFLRVLYALYAWLFDQFESQICPCAVANAPLQSKTPPCLILRCNSSKKTCFFWC